MQGGVFGVLFGRGLAYNSYKAAAVIRATFFFSFFSIALRLRSGVAPLNREAFLEFYPEEAINDLEPASFFAKYKTNRITLQQAKDYEEVLVKR